LPEPLIRVLPREEVPEDLQPAYDASVERLGFPMLGAFANSPAVTRWYFDKFYSEVFYNGIPGMTVDVRSKELLRIKLSKQHGCLFCNKSNTIDAIAAGISQEAIDAIFEPQSEHWSDKDRAVMALADQMMLQNMEGHLSPELYEKLREHFNDGELIELGFIAAVLTGVAKWIFTYDLVDREETCPIKLPAAAGS